ncbi:MAG: hypothetical protein PHC85_02705 [Candidatus Pacebacteria bacterium]|nr:hypothetical protein [Candidatus Paceibacterota bacterium]
MLLKELQISGFKSFAKKISLDFPVGISAIVGPNGSGKSNVTEAIAWVLGEQSMKSLRGKKGEDLIFNGSHITAKASKASASLIFSESAKGDDSVISRSVYRDGTNEYFFNGKECRLKDILEFLSAAGGGTLRHHIISQGEADRILNTSSKERMSMVEDALGLRIYQLKKEEGERKLEKTLSNMKEIESVRREIQPHLKFLKKQVEKANEVFSWKEELAKLSSSFFFSAEKRFEKEKEEIFSEKSTAEKEVFSASKDIEDSKKKLAGNRGMDLELNKAGEKISEIEREIGRCEGILSHLKSAAEREPEKEKISRPAIDLKEAVSFFKTLEEKIDEALVEKDLQRIKSVLLEIKKRLDVFKKEEKKEELVKKDIGSEIEGIEKKRIELSKLLKIAREEKELIDKERAASFDVERALFQKEMKLSEAKSKLNLLAEKEKDFSFKSAELAKDREEIEAILGSKIDFSGARVLVEEETEKEKKKIERLKIKVEESGGLSGEIMKEYEEVKNRDEFLASELGDMGRTEDSLRTLIKQLEEKLGEDFKDGVKKINIEFQNFFELMFGGGRAEIKIITPPRRKKKDQDLLEGEKEVPISGDCQDAGGEEAEDGIDISVNLPRKKIHSLNMLSGGERALTSIALLFAVSQVNPPPFLILDETDAALDESNSKKYGAMLKELSQKTQLILVTHNRETMSAASVLYGVTMGADGSSRILSVKFDEAEEMVKSKL